MDKHLQLGFLFLSFTLCFNNILLPKDKGATAKFAPGRSKSATIGYADITVTLFGDTSYKLTLHVFDSVTDDPEINNSVLTFYKKEKNNVKIFFRDSMYCYYTDITFIDFNSDQIKDVVIFYFTGARANPTYHLYLTDKKNKKLIRIKGFEELPNPILDSTNNIIESVALSGSNYYSFYRINKQNKLINLGHDFAEDPQDSTQYDRAIQQILRKHK
jgi:hypothetical protein